MASELETFFDKGLQHYPAAKRAVGEFEALMSQRLAEAMRRQEGSACTRLPADPPQKPRVAAGVYGATVYYGLAADMAGSADGPSALTGRLELGLWWEPPFEATERLWAYAGVYGPPWSKRLVKPAGFKGELEKSSTAYLSLPVARAEALPGVLDALLRYLNAACAAARKRHEANRKGG